MCLVWLLSSLALLCIVQQIPSTAPLQQNEHVLSPFTKSILTTCRLQATCLLALHHICISHSRGWGNALWFHREQL